MKRKLILPLIAGILGLAIFIPCAAVIQWCKGIQPDQLAAQRWGEDFVQVSCYISEYAKLSSDGISQIRDALQQSIEEDLMTEIDAAWYDVYSCDAKSVSVLGEKIGAKNMELMLVSENYFRIHANQLVSGSWLTEADVSSLRVVLDEKAAWKLFGSTDVVGMNVTFDNRICEIAGVVQMPDDFATKAVLEDTEPQIFMLYEDYASSAAEKPSITAYEAILPEQVEGYGLSLMEKAMKNFSDGTGMADDNAESKGSTDEMDDETDTYFLVQNTDRFSLSGVWDYLHHHTDYILHQGTIPYPTSENAALVLLHRISMLTLAAAAGIVLMLFAVILAGIRLRNVCKNICCSIFLNVKKGISDRKLRKRYYTKEREYSRTTNQKG